MAILHCCIKKRTADHRSAPAIEESVVINYRILTAKITLFFLRYIDNRGFFEEFFNIEADWWHLENLSASFLYLNGREL